MQHKFSKKILVLLLMAAMALIILPLTAVPALAATGVTYLDANGATQTTDATDITGSETVLGVAGTTTWYVANNTVTFSSRLAIIGNVNIILADGCLLDESNGGIQVAIGNTLNIFAQSTDPGTMGKLTAISKTEWYSGIGGGYSMTGTIVINGGAVTATGGSQSAGIGSDGGNSALGTGNIASTVIINGGVVTATGGENAAGIGGGSGDKGSAITITGGTVNAACGGISTGISGGAGIGGGVATYEVGDTILIYGENTKVTAAGGGGGQDIGSGLSGVKGTTFVALPVGNLSLASQAINNVLFTANPTTTTGVVTATLPSVLNGISSVNLMTGLNNTTGKTMSVLTTYTTDTVSFGLTGYSNSPITNTGIELMTTGTTVQFGGAPAATHTATLNVYKDGSAWSGHGKTFTLRQSGTAIYTGTGNGSPVTFNFVVDGTYNIFDGDTDTGTTITISGGDSNAALNYYSVTYNVTDNTSGLSNGSTISATYNGGAVNSGDVVLGGKQLVITATGTGTDQYTYSWSGAGTSGETVNSIIIPSLSSAVDAQCTVYGTQSLYTATINLTLDGAAFPYSDVVYLKLSGNESNSVSLYVA